MATERDLCLLLSSRFLGGVKNTRGLTNDVADRYQSTAANQSSMKC